MTVSKFVCRNFSGHVRKAAGMFAALSWTPAQTGWVFCWLPLCDSCVTGPPQLAFYMCACECLCVFIQECVCTYVRLKAAVSFLNVICVCSTQAFLVSHHWPADVCLCSFLAQKGPSDLELVPEEYSVMIGSYPCNISFHNDQLFHCTINGLLSSRERELPVTVSASPCKTTKMI